MRPRHPRISAARVTLLFVLFAVAALAGCVSPFEPRDGDAESADDAGDDQDATNGTDAAQDGDPGNESTGREAPPDADPVDPAQAEVDDEDELDQPGEFVMHEPREGRRTDVSVTVPAWEIDDSWDVEMDHYGWDFACLLAEPPVPAQQHPVRSYTVEGHGERANMSVHDVAMSYTDCAGRQSEPATTQFVADHIEPFDKHGFIPHNLVFPLEDGLRWSYIDFYSQQVDVEVTYVESYSWSGGTAPAWHLEAFQAGQRGGSDAWTERWFVEDAKNVVRTEYWSADADEPKYCLEVRDDRCLKLTETVIGYDV